MPPSVLFSPRLPHPSLQGPTQMSPLPWIRPPTAHTATFHLPRSFWLLLLLALNGVFSAHLPCSHSHAWLWPPPLLQLSNPSARPASPKLWSSIPATLRQFPLGVAQVSDILHVQNQACNFPSPLPQILALLLSRGRRLCMGACCVL